MSDASPYKALGGAAAVAALVGALTQAGRLDDLIVSDAELQRECVSRIERLENKLDRQIETARANLTIRKKRWAAIEDKLGPLEEE